MTSLRRYFPIATVGALLSLGLIFMLSGCDSSAPTDDGELVESGDLNVAERIDVQDGLGTLKTALGDAGLLDSLRNENAQFTVFAPSLGDVNTSAMKNLDVFSDVIQYHVVKGQSISSGNLPDEATTMSGETLQFGDGTVNGATIVEADLPATNGVVHRVSRTLLENQSVRTRLAVSGATQTYNQAIVANENDDPNQRVDYSGSGITVFAPTENAWIEWDTGGSNPFFTDGFFERDPTLIQDLLNYHMVDEELTASDLTQIANGRAAIETMTGDSLQVSTTENGAVTIDDARVTTANLEATNGLVHHLGARPSPSFYSVLGGPVDILEGVPTHQVMTVNDRVSNNLFTINSFFALQSSVFASQVGLAPPVPLDNTGASFTAIVPTNGAFSAAGFNTNNLINGLQGGNPNISQQPSLLAGSSLFRGHLIQGQSLSSDELAEEINNANGSKTYGTVNGNNLRIETFGSNSDSLRINGRLEVTTTNLETNNGYIHYVSGGLIQSHLTVPERVMFSSPLSSVAKGIYEIGLDAPLAGPGRTLFAPIDDAFSALPDGVPRSLLRDESEPGGLYEKILSYHAIASSESATDLQNAGEGTSFPTLQGQDITVASTGPPIEIQGNGNANPVPVQQADSASNGFVHSIEGILLPDPSRAFNVVESAILNGFLKFRTALDVTGGRSTVESEDGITVVAPTEGAFQAYLEGTDASSLETLTSDEEDNLSERLQMHVALRDLSEDDIRNQLAGPGDVFIVETLFSENPPTPVFNPDDYQLAFSLSEGNIVVQPAGAVGDDLYSPVPISQTNIQANNGTVHGLEAVLSLP
mgnify:CR=1 FL=1